MRVVNRNFLPAKNLSKSNTETTQQQHANPGFKLVIKIKRMIDGTLTV
jgi:hypothetical protein